MLRAHLNQLAVRTSLNQQGHVIPQWSSIEPSMDVPNDCGDGVRRHRRIFTHHSLDQLIDHPLFAQLDHTTGLHPVHLPSTRCTRVHFLLAISGVLACPGLRGSLPAAGSGMRRSCDGRLRGSPGCEVGPRVTPSTARDDHPVGPGGTPGCHPEEWPSVRDAVGSSRAAPRHPRGTGSHRSATAPLPERRRAHPTASSRRTVSSHGGPPSQVTFTVEPGPQRRCP